MGKWGYLVNVYAVLWYVLIPANLVPSLIRLIPVGHVLKLG